MIFSWLTLNVSKPKCFFNSAVTLLISGIVVISNKARLKHKFNKIEWDKQIFFDLFVPKKVFFSKKY